MGNSEGGGKVSSAFSIMIQEQQKIGKLLSTVGISRPCLGQIPRGD
jgi:hypothetical protein